MKTKRLYQSPLTRRDEVELEDGFCGSIYETKSIEAQGHEVGGNYRFDVSESATGEQTITGSSGSVSWE